MVKFIEENERIKHDYATYLHHAKGQDEASIDKARAAIRRFEDSTKVKPFKKFHRQQAADFKDFLNRQKNTKTGKPLGISTVDATLRLVKGFFHWLVSRAGFRRVLNYADVEYFNNTRKAGRVAHTQREIPYPSMQQVAHAFQAMPFETEFEKRDKALFAFLMLTAARDGAVASLKIKHVNMVLGHVFQDAREVKTKAAKTIHCQFFPVDAAYRTCFAACFTYLSDVKLFGPEDALFPKARVAFVAEVRSLAHVLGQTIGRAYQASCDAALGDARCGVNLEATAFKGSGVVLALIRDRGFVASGLGAFATGWFASGTVEWTSGANAGRRAEVMMHEIAATEVSITLMEVPVRALAIGDAFVIRAGCDKRLETCRDRFANALNFRGFPNIPGQDAVLRYAASGDANQGVVL